MDWTSERIQVYIVAGALALVIVVFIITVIVLCRMIKSVKRHNNANRTMDHAYTNPAIQPGEELNRRGYQMHGGGVAPRLQNAGNGMYTGSRDNSTSGYMVGRAVEQNDRYASPNERGTKDASKDFATMMNNDEPFFIQQRQKNNIFPGAQAPARSSLINDNILLGAGQQQPDGNKFYNNRAMNY